MKNTNLTLPFTGSFTLDCLHTIACKGDIGAAFAADLLVAA